MKIVVCNEDVVLRSTYETLIVRVYIDNELMWHEYINEILLWSMYRTSISSPTMKIVAGNIQSASSTTKDAVASNNLRTFVPNCDQFGQAK